MEEPLDEVYFNWLYTKVASVEVPTPSLTYYTLLGALHSTEFVWLVTGDDNRASDGLELRREFYREYEAAYHETLPWMNIGCSVLEMLISFARRAEFQTDIPTRDWFWVFLENLQLADLNDAQQDVNLICAEIMDQFLWRTYRSSGEGGMFPLRYSANDQRKVEIWYQFCEYLVDQERL
jgi:hypothetical protein